MAHHRDSLLRALIEPFPACQIVASIIDNEAHRGVSPAMSGEAGQASREIYRAIVGDERETDWFRRRIRKRRGGGSSQAMTQPPKTDAGDRKPAWQGSGDLEPTTLSW